MKTRILAILLAVPLLAGGDPITVNGPPLEFPVGIRGAVELEFDTEVNEYYQVIMSPDMVAWDNEGYSIKGTGGTVSTVVSTRNWPTAFYRVTDGADPNNTGPYTATSPVTIANNVIELEPAGYGEILWSNGTSWLITQMPERTVDNMQPWLCVNFIIALEGIYPSRSSSEPFIGEIIMFGGNYAPRGWALCDGQLLPINQWSALFSIIGTYYGGDGRTTFGLPDLRGRVPVHYGSGPGLTPRQLGQKSGTETTSHSH